MPDGPIGPEEVEDLVTRFIERYEAIYGRGSAFVEAGVEVGLLTVKAWGRIRSPEINPRRTCGRACRSRRRPATSIGPGSATS